MNDVKWEIFLDESGEVQIQVATLEGAYVGHMWPNPGRHAWSGRSVSGDLYGTRHKLVSRIESDALPPVKMLHIPNSLKQPEVSIAYYPSGEVAGIVRRDIMDARCWFATTATGANIQGDSDRDFCVQALERYVRGH